MSVTPEGAPIRPAYVRDADGLYYKIGGGSGDGLTPAELLPGLNVTLDKVTTPGSVIISAELVGDEEGPAPATGGIVEDVGGYRIHTFNSSSTMVFPNDTLVDVLLVAGGGGSANWRGGAGGAGGVLIQPGVTVTAGNKPIVVGLGGAIGDPVGANGGNSTAFGFTAIGGGGGGLYATAGVAGGSGGGSGTTENQGTKPGGAGTPGQGFAGGSQSNNDGTGGGGGAGGFGVSGVGSTGGAAGVGIQSSYSGTAKWYAGGGGGGGRTTGVPGGSGVGGAGGSAGGAPGMAVVNSGGGGGGGFDHAGGSGADGVVIVRYAYTPAVLPVTTLDSLTDVAAPAPTDGQVLKWASASSAWVPGTVSGGGGGSVWTETVNDPLSSLTGWTVRSGTWAINGGVFRQSDSSGNARQRIVRDTGALPVAGACCRVEARIISGSGDHRVGIYHGWDGSSTSGGYFGCMNTPNATTLWQAYHENDAAAGGPSNDIGYDLAYGQWFSIATRRVSASADLFINDVLVNSWNNAPMQGTKIGFHIFNCVAELRNLQIWTRTEDVPPWD